MLNAIARGAVPLKTKQKKTFNKRPNIYQADWNNGLSKMTDEQVNVE